MRGSFAFADGEGFEDRISPPDQHLHTIEHFPVVSANQSQGFDHWVHALGFGDRSWPVAKSKGMGVGSPPASPASGCFRVPPGDTFGRDKQCHPLGPRDAGSVEGSGMPGAGASMFLMLPFDRARVRRKGARARQL